MPILSNKPELVQIKDLITIGIPISSELPAGTQNIGDVDVVSLPGTVQADIGTMQDDTALIKADIATVKADVALIKAAVPIDGSTKTVTVLDDDVTLVASDPDHESSVWTIDDGYGGLLYLKNTNGATGPTVAAASQVWGSPDNSNWYKIGGSISWTLGNAVVSSLVVPIPQGVKYCKVISGSNTDQATTFRAEGVEITAQS